MDGGVNSERQDQLIPFAQILQRDFQSLQFIWMAGSVGRREVSVQMAWISNSGKVEGSAKGLVVFYDTDGDGV